MTEFHVPGPPLILTLKLDAAAHAWFDGLRRQYFPPGRVQVGAHVTLFHALPGRREAEIVRYVSTLCSGHPQSAVSVKGLRFLGRGVAFALVAPGVANARAAIAAEFAGALTAQDRAAWSPHITIQNKVAPEDARQTQALLATLSPPPIVAHGIDIWRYRGGPWEWVRSCCFTDKEQSLAASQTTV